MIVTTQDNSMLNLDNFDALEMKYQGYYNRSEYTIFAVIFDDNGGVAVENRVCQFRSQDEVDAYFQKVEERTAYIRMPTPPTSLTPKSLTLLNLARFHSLYFMVKDVPPSTKTQATVKATRYDEFGAEMKTVAYRAEFTSKGAAVEWFEELTQRRAT